MSDWPNLGTSQRLCLLSDVRCVMAYDGVAGLYNVYPDGIEHSDPIQAEPIEEYRKYRLYACINCGFECQGETFTEMQAHLGKRNPYLHPFAESIASLAYDRYVG